MRNLLFVFILLLPLCALGQNVPVIKITDLEKQIHLDNDTTYIINFWATWCAPCVKELPDFDSITKTLSNEKVKVLLVTMDFKEDKETKVIPFIHKKQLQSTVLLLDELNGNYFIPKVSETWSGAIPATLIINNKKAYKEFYEKKLTYAFLKSQIDTIKNK